MPQSFSKRTALETAKPKPIANDESSLTLVTLWESLREFVGKLENFFERGFNGSPPILQFSLEYPPLYVMRRIAEQTGHDMELITRALGQREIYHKSDAPQSALNTLKIADWIAYHIALKPAIDAGFLPETTAITYFEKALNSRVIPYAPVALIGFPFYTIDTIAEIEATLPGSLSAQSQQAQTEDFPFLNHLLAIPHEVGHYVYWHASAHGNHLPVEVYQHVFGDKPQWVLNWIEELYADIYGYVIAGPVAALQLIEMLQAGGQQSLLYDDGEHPIPVLRIHAAIVALESLKLPIAAKEMKDTWYEWLGTQKIDDKFLPNNNPENVITLDEGRAIVQEVVQAIIALEFMELRTNHLNRSRDAQDGLYAEWRSLNNENLLSAYRKQFQVIIKQLRESVAKPKSLTVPQLINKHGVLHITINSQSISANHQKLGETHTWLDTFLTLPKEMPIQEINAQVWMALLEAGGWISGPQGNIIQPKSK